MNNNTGPDPNEIAFDKFLPNDDGQTRAVGGFMCPEHSIPSRRQILGVPATPGVGAVGFRDNAIVVLIPIKQIENSMNFLRLGRRVNRGQPLAFHVKPFCTPVH